MKRREYEITGVFNGGGRNITFIVSHEQLMEEIAGLRQRGWKRINYRKVSKREKQGHYSPQRLAAAAS